MNFNPAPIEVAIAENCDVLSTQLQNELKCHSIQTLLFFEQAQFFHCQPGPRL